MGQNPWLPGSHSSGGGPWPPGPALYGSAVAASARTMLALTRRWLNRPLGGESRGGAAAMCTTIGEEAWGRQPPGLSFGSDRTLATYGEEGRC
jgi:hypothetical protein